jgi:integrase
MPSAGRSGEYDRVLERRRAVALAARHTYASFLMAAGYNLKQIQDYLGHADLVTTGRYIKNLPEPRGTTERAKLQVYLAQEIGDI